MKTLFLVLSSAVLIFASAVSSLPTAVSEGLDDKKLPEQKPELPVVGTEHSGYPQLLTRKTTRLLSEALHMLNRVKDVKERRWLESFVHRLELLASELDRKASAKVPGNGTTKDLVAFSKGLAETNGQIKDFVVRGVTEKVEDLNKEVSVGVAEKAPEGNNHDELESQLRSQPVSEQQRHEQMKVMLLSNKTPKLSEEQESLEKSMALHRETKLRMEKMKEAEKNKILKEIYALSQKLHELGGETKSVLDVIKRSRGGVQIGTGHHFWEGAHPEALSKANPVSGQESITSAPSSSQLREADIVPATKMTLSVAATSSKDDQSDEDDSEESEATDSEDNNDDLEKQLQDEKLILDEGQLADSRKKADDLRRE